MIDRSIARARPIPLLGLLLAACSTTLAPTPTRVDLRPTPTPAPATFVPASAPEPTVDPQPLPSTSLFGWWEETIHYGCHPPAYVRVDGVVTSLGVCPGALDDSPQSITLDVGQDFDIHMAVHADGAAPIYPLPEAVDPLVAQGWLIFDKATMTYRALSPGTTRLMTTGSCWITDDSPTGIHDVDGPCPVLEVHVRDIETRCVELAEDLCRAAGAGAILVGWFPASTGRVVGWEVTPESSTIDWPGCGHVFATVTVTLRDPAEQLSITMGQPEPEADPLRVAECTY